jgi:pimeloyl-ACP methyl ester carboxylesterase
LATARVARKIRRQLLRQSSRTRAAGIRSMDDVLVNDDVEDVTENPAAGWGISTRLADWMRQSPVAAPVSAMRRLAELYVSQTSLIFPGRQTQGLPVAKVESREGVELVRARTPSGDQIAGLFGAAQDTSGHPVADPRSRPTMLFFYGNENHLACRNVAHVFDGLRRIGANVLIPEYVGYGLSTGDACEAGCYATADAAFQHLLSRNDNDPGRIVVAGASLGGAVAIDLASRECRVAGLVTLITFTSMPDMARVLQPTLPIWRFIRHKFESERKMPRVKCPALLIHSTGDALVPYSMADRLASACAGPVSRLKIEGAGHSSVEMLEGGGNLIYDAMTEFLTRI